MKYIKDAEDYTGYKLLVEKWDVCRQRKDRIITEQDIGMPMQIN